MPAPGASDSAATAIGAATPVTTLSSNTVAVPSNWKGESLVTKHAPAVLQVLIWSANVEALNV
jgi:hypothetical protein